jgi:hypothetical protein
MFVARGGRWFRRHRAAAFTGVLALLAISAILTLANLRSSQQAKSEHGARVAAEQAQDRSLILAAQFAARTVAGVVEAIDRTVEIEALDPELRLMLEEIDKAGATTPEQHTKLQAWLDSRFIKHSAAINATTWFITDARGTQVARSPASGDTEGRSFAMRDYFHGGGRELTPQEVAANPPAPLRQTHVSRAFRSRATGLLMVAFSTPVWSGRPRAAGSRVLGLLATSVTANRFDVLQLDAGKEDAEELVVLIDLREDWLEPEAKRGLVLHHQHLAQAPPKGSRNSDLVRVHPLTVDRLTELWKQAAKRERTAAEGTSTVNDLLMRAYVDALGKWTAALAPVVVSRPADAVDDDQEDASVRWAVMVQRRQAQ